MSGSSAPVLDASQSPASAIARPRDGPATEFEVDPVMREILEAEGRSLDEFGLVLVIGWPASPQLEQPYANFCAAMRSCFDDDDSKNAYLYPLESVHVTVATLHSFTIKTGVCDAELRATVEREWRAIVVGASKRPEWPTCSLQLEIDSCQIGARACILLWHEMTGGLKQMRYCVEQETLARQWSLRAAGLSSDTLRIPGIVHSSVLRFPFPIITDGHVVQERFQANVVPQLKDFFPKPIEAPTAVLVCERTPYLHHPCDDKHALEIFDLIT